MPDPELRGLLVVSQDAERGRHQMLLLQLLRHLQAAGRPVALVLWEGGPLLGEMRDACADVQVVEELHEWWPARLLQRSGQHRVADGLKGRRLRWRLRDRRRSPVLVHGGRPARMLGYLDADRPAVVLLHDLDPAFEVADEVQRLLGADLALVLDRADAFIVADGHLRAPLAVVAGIDQAQVGVHGAYGDVDVGRAAIDLPEGATVLVAVGTRDWWRAPDQVVPLFWRLVERAPERSLHLVWLCEDDDPDGVWPLLHDAQSAGVADRVHVVQTDAPLDQLAVADLVLAAGRTGDLDDVLDDLRLAGRPVVTAHEHLAAQIGAAATAVPFLDLAAATEATLGLLEDAASVADGSGSSRSGAATLLDLVDALVADEAHPVGSPDPAESGAA